MEEIIEPSKDKAELETADRWFLNKASIAFDYSISM